MNIISFEGFHMLYRILGIAVLGLAVGAYTTDAGRAQDKKDDTKKLAGVTGTIKSVDKKEGSFTITVEKKDRKFTVNDDTKFVGPKGGKRGMGKEGLSDDCMDKGYEVRVVPAKDAKVAAEVNLPNRKTETKDKK
jgi:hypothetical protein